MEYIYGIPWSQGFLLVFWQIRNQLFDRSPGWSPGLLRISGLICRRWDASFKIFGRMEKSPIPLVRKVISSLRKDEKNHEEREVEAIWTIFESFRITWKLSKRSKKSISICDLDETYGPFFPFQIFHGWHITDIRFKLRECRGWSKLEPFLDPNFYRFNRVQLISPKKKSATISSDPPWVPRWLWHRAQRARPERFGAPLSAASHQLPLEHPIHPIQSP